MILVLMLLMLSGLGLGRWLALSKSMWRLGVAWAMLAVVITSLARRFDTVATQAPFDLLVAGHTEYLIYAFFAPIFFLPLMPRLRSPQRRAVGVFLVASLFYYSVLPLALPLALRAEHAALKTEIDILGICRQTTSYTCGPAAAVTALAWIDVPAEEAEFAVAAHSNPVSGTQADFLCEAINARLPTGWQARYATYPDVESFAADLPALAIIRQTFMADHYVAVIEAVDGSLVIGDPGPGLRILEFAEFAKIWRCQAIVIEQLQRQAGT
jgi:hypothetical protein